MAKHLIVMSVDAMVFEDLEILKHCKNTARLLKNGALIERMHTIYPSLTHPVHVTCMTDVILIKPAYIQMSILYREN